MAIPNAPIDLKEEFSNDVVLAITPLKDATRICFGFHSGIGGSIQMLDSVVFKEPPNKVIHKVRLALDQLEQTLRMK